MVPSINTLNLLLKYEVGGGETYYNRHLKNPVYPGESSGVTIGVGYDLGYNSEEQFLEDWKDLSASTLNTLSSCIGLKGSKAQAKIASVKHIEIPWNIAYSVFVKSTIPRFWRETQRAFPGVDNLPSDAQGALLSLIFNRGASMQGDRRLEMRQIQDAISRGNVIRIPSLIRSMTRLWVGTSIEVGMRRRREDEARLFESALVDSTPTLLGGETVIAPTHLLSRVLLIGSEGEDVKILQETLTQLGYYSNEIDGKFGSNTDKAVRNFQRIAGLTVDGKVGKNTWAELQGTSHENLSVAHDEQSANREKLAAFAKKEAAKNLRWTGADSQAEKYLAPLREPMRRLGHIGSAPVFFNWCAAWVTYCCRQVGYTIPDQPEGLNATMALVQAWKFWALSNGYWHDIDDITPKRGDIVCFEWHDGDSQLDHIGIVQDYTPGSSQISTSEGNAGNRTINRIRNMSNVAGIIRLN